VSGLRQHNKAKRRDAILDAAVSLLGARPSEEVTTEEIAALAGVSPATVYNLVGTRDELLHQLVARVLERLGATLREVDPSDPITAARTVVDQTVQAFVADASAYKQVVAHAQRAGPDRSLAVDPSSFQVAAMRAAQQAGILRDDLDAAAVGRQVFLSYVGAMVLWSAGRLDDRGFAMAARHGLATALAAAAADAHREGFLEELQALGTVLEHDAWQHHDGDEPG
jgi:AcrR family transcriptional regulator